MTPLIFPSSTSGRVGWPWSASEKPRAYDAENEWPKISVVTPSYNQGGFLEETIRSVLCQEYPNLEYVVIDGASTDQSVSILKKYDPWLAYWESSPDRGQTHAINKGLEHCTGEIVAYLNSDDTYLPDTFNRVARFFAENPDVDLIYGNCRVLDENGHCQETWESRTFDPVVELSRNFIFQPTAFWRRSLVERIGVFREHLQYVMDIDYWYRALSVGNLTYLNEDLACFRIHDGSKTGQGGNFIAERKGVLDEFFVCNAVDEINRHRTLVYAWHHFHAGSELYGAGDLSSSVVEFCKSFKLQPLSVRSWYILLGLLDRKFGTRLFSMMQKLHYPSP